MPEAYYESCQTFKVEVFCENSEQLRKKLHLRCFIGFWIPLCMPSAYFYFGLNVVFHKICIRTSQIQLVHLNQSDDVWKARKNACLVISWVNHWIFPPVLSYLPILTWILIKLVFQEQLLWTSRIQRL